MLMKKIKNALLRYWMHDRMKLCVTRPAQCLDHAAKAVRTKRINFKKLLGLNYARLAEHIEARGAGLIDNMWGVSIRMEKIDIACHVLNEV